MEISPVFIGDHLLPKDYKTLILKKNYTPAFIQMKLIFVH